MCVLTVCFSVCSRLLEAGGASLQSLSLSDSHLAELDGETLRLFGLGALEALERGWGVQTAGAVTVIAFRYIHFDAIVPTLPRIRVKFPNLSVRTHLLQITYCSIKSILIGYYDRSHILTMVTHALCWSSKLRVLIGQ